MRTSVDALMSVRRWVRSVLPGPPWRIMLAADPGRVERPYAVVNTADGNAVTQDGVNAMRNQLPIVVHAFPPDGSRPSASKLIAERVAAGLSRAIEAGVPDYQVPTIRTASKMIPLFDYGGVNPEDYTSEEALDLAATVRLRPDYLLVADGWKAQSVPQADEGQMFVATLEMRVQWFSAAGLRSAGTTPLQRTRVRIR